MGMSMETFLMLTPGQFQEAYNAFRIAVEAQREHSELTAWQVARWQVWRTLCPPAKKEINVFDLIELPGDEKVKKEKTVAPSTVDRFNVLTEKWK